MVNFSMRLLACVVALIPSMAAWALRSSFTVVGWQWLDCVGTNSMTPEAAYNRARRVCVEWSHSQGSTSDLIIAIAQALTRGQWR